MAKVKFNRKEFEKYIKLSKDIEEKISMFGTHLESVDNNELEVEVNPNRPDLLSLQGFMRSFLPFIGKKIKESYEIHKPEKNFLVKIDKSVKEARPFTACAIIKNLKFNDEKIKEIIDIQEKIHLTLGRSRKKIAIGIYPLEKIKLPIKYEARKPQDIKFIPLEFDKELNGLQILQQHPAGRDYSFLLEGKEKFPVFVDSNNEILSMPPIINSEKTGKITEKTTSVFVECSGFDLALLKKTLNILVTMLADMQGEVYQMKLKYEKEEITPDLTPEKMTLHIENANKLLGLQLKENEIKKLLEKMGYEYEKKQVFAPAYRTDIMHEVDIIEDIAIAYGYENFEPEIPEISSIGEIDKKEIMKKKISDILIGLNLLEISTLHLITKEDLKKAGEKAIEVRESKTDYKVLRANLLVSLLKILSENVNSEYPQKIFEIGKIFELDEKEEACIKEKEKLVVALTPSNFTELKQILEYLARMLNIEFKIEEAEKDGFISGRAGKIIHNGKEIGILGEMHPSTLKLWHLKMPLACLEIDLTDILEKIQF